MRRGNHKSDTMGILNRNGRNTLCVQLVLKSKLLAIAEDQVSHFGAEIIQEQGRLQHLPPTLTNTLELVRMRNSSGAMCE